MPVEHVSSLRELAESAIGTETPPHHDCGAFHVNAEWVLATLDTMEAAQRDRKLLRDALDLLLRVSLPHDISGVAWIKNAREALAATADPPGVTAPQPEERCP
jgi:hypothetical protein